jgi:hypothetical protein
MAQHIYNLQLTERQARILSYACEVEEFGCKTVKDVYDIVEQAINK